MSIYIGTNKPTKIYVGTQAVKKVYVGTQLVWPSGTVTGSFGSYTHKHTFGNNGRGNQYYLEFVVKVTKKDYGANTCAVSVLTYLGSVGNYNIKASYSHTNATVTIDGNSRTLQAYNATTPAGTKKKIGDNGATLSNASSKSKITIKFSVPLNVTINDGVGRINTVSGQFTYTMPSFY